MSNFGIAQIYDCAHRFHTVGMCFYCVASRYCATCLKAYQDNSPWVPLILYLNPIRILPANFPSPITHLTHLLREKVILTNTFEILSSISA